MFAKKELPEELRSLHHVNRSDRSIARVLNSTPCFVAAHAPQLIIQPTLRWPQRSSATAVKKICLSEWLEGFQFPCLEDFVNQLPFTSYFGWVEQHDPDTDGPSGPSLHTSTHKTWTQISAGSQPGAHNAGQATPPFFGLDLIPDEHFDHAQALGQANGLPWSEAPCADQDLILAAESTVARAASFREFRLACQRAFSAVAAVSIP